MDARPRTLLRDRLENAKGLGRAMEWSDSGFVLSVRPHGETSTVVDLLTRERGRHAGLVRGGRSRRHRPVLQPGNRVSAVWKARLEDHLGTLSVELEQSNVGRCFDDRVALDALNAACALMLMTLPERERHRPIFEAFDVLMTAMDDRDVWPALFVRWELGVLQELGYRLDLSKCAVSGTTDDLTHVSPKSGRAVSAKEAEPYAGKLLELPAFLLYPQENPPTGLELSQAFKLTGYFLEKWVLAPTDKALPDARFRLLDKLSR